MAKLLLRRGLTPDRNTVFSNRISVVFSKDRPTNPASGTLWVNYDRSTNNVIEKYYFSNDLKSFILNSSYKACAWIPIENSGNIILNALNNNSLQIKFNSNNIRNVQVRINGRYQEHETELYYEGVWYI